MALTTVKEVLNAVAENRGKRVFLYFIGTLDASGQSWCPDCRAAQPVVDSCLPELPPDCLWFNVWVGDRQTWRDGRNEFKLSPELRIKAIPTLFEFGKTKRLVEKEFLDRDAILDLFRDVVFTSVDELKRALIENAGKRRFVYFMASPDETGKSWCPDCRKAAPIVDRILPRLPVNSVWLTVYTGDKPTWQNPNNEFRQCSELRVAHVPTLLEYGKDSRLIEHELEDEKAILNFIKPAALTTVAEVMQKIESNPGKRCFLYFIASPQKDGESWCPHCRNCRPVVDDVLPNLPKNAIWIEVHTGSRIVWKDPDNEFRKSPKLNVMNVPTLFEYGKENRLIEKDLLNKAALRALLRYSPLTSVAQVFEAIGDNLGKRCFLYFVASPDETGESWCPDCRKSQLVINEVLPKLPNNAVWLELHTGDKDTWKNEGNEFRLCSQLRVTNVPTLFEFGRRTRLVENQITVETVLELFQANIL